MNEEIKDIDVTVQSGELALPTTAESGIVDPSVFGGQSWVPYLKIMQCMSREVKDGQANFRDVIWNKQENLGPEFPAWVIAYKPAALKFERGQVALKSNNMVVEGKKIVGDNDFVAIMNGRDDLKNGIRHCWGAEILCYVPFVRDFGQFFFGTATARNSIPEFQKFLRKPGVIYIEEKELKHGGTVGIPHIRAFNAMQRPDYWCQPTQQELAAALAKFYRVTQPSSSEEVEIPS